MTTSDNIAALEGVTPGPWEAKQNAYGAAFIYGGETLTTSVGTEYRELVAGGNSHDTLKMENATYIAACSPDRISALLAEARKAEAMELDKLQLREALLGLEHACEQLAATRSLEIYSAMIDGGQTQELLELDNARRRARTLLNGGSDAQG